MAIKNFFVSSENRKFGKIVILISALAFAGCSNIKTREDIKNGSIERTSILPPPALRPSPSPTPGEVTLSPSPTPVPTPQNATGSSDVKVGIILGPGGAKALAHIGVLQELNKAKIPLQAVVGIEMGALIGAVYCQKAQPFDVDWQLAKLKDLKAVNSFTQTLFGNSKFDDLRLTFACPVLQLTRGQSQMMTKGSVNSVLPACYSSPPLFRPAPGQFVADVLQVRTAIDFLKQHGANFIVYVDVLKSRNGVFVGALDDSENVYWNFTFRGIQDQLQSLLASELGYIISVPTQDFELRDWNRKHELVQKGVEAGSLGASEIAKKLGL